MKKFGILIFIVALVVGIALANVFSFGKLSPLVKFSFDFGRVRGSGNIVTQKRDLSGFSKIDAGGAYEIEIVAQKDFSVEVQGDDNLIEFVKTEVHGDTLEISKGSVSMNMRDLERWGMAKEVWVRGERRKFYKAES
ncbi:MAG TPA: DUF2807 domain-containing protein, partial [Pyrinomonadaceae bacterium]|nr:DUF2807 domain-containing protein [Pyrinomonadaceae bacterium]